MEFEGVDRRPRELERRCRASGSFEDAVAWLRERLRTGDLAPERARLAAWLGHPAAEAVTGMRFGDEPLRRASDVRRAEAALWEGVAVAGAEAAQRALLADARRLQAAARVVLGRGAARDDRRKAAGWLRAAAQVLEAARDLVVAGAATSGPGAPTRADVTLLGLRRPPLRGALDPEGLQAYQDLPAALERLVASFDGPARPWVATRTWWRFRALQQALRVELVPWALGPGDPLRGPELGRGQQPSARLA